MTWRIGRLLTAVLAGVVLAACASSQAANTSGGHTLGSGQCAEPCVLFHVQVSFSGLDAIQGSFVDNTSGTGLSSSSPIPRAAARPD